LVKKSTLCDHERNQSIFMRTRSKLMTSISQMQRILREVLETQANELARETGFITRERAFSGADFVQGLVFGWLGEPGATLQELTQALCGREVTISASGLSQRFGPEAADFLHAVLQRLVQATVCTNPAPIELLNRFEAVVLEDSTTIALPDALQERWPGCGGSREHTAAALKIHVQWDLRRGSLRGPVLTPSRVADQCSPLRAMPLEAGTLYISDLGYFGLTWLRHHAASGGWFLTRPRSNTGFLDEEGQELCLQEIGPRAVHQSLQRNVLVGKSVKLPARLLMIRLPEEVVQDRRVKITATAHKHGKEPNPQQLELAQWTILITNVPAEQLSISEAVVLQRARWQIELLFKLWKEHGRLDEWRSKNHWRILCELLAKLMALVIQHWALLQGSWQDPYRSLVKAAKIVRKYALEWIEVLMGHVSLSRLLRRLERVMRSGCQVNRRVHDPALAQLLLEGLNWTLT
jgi:hypothetical protein